MNQADTLDWTWERGLKYYGCVATDSAKITLKTQSALKFGQNQRSRIFNH